jgi:hypothetical protein
MIKKKWLSTFAIFLALSVTTGCVPKTDPFAAVEVIGQPTLAVAMSNSLTSLISQQRLSPLAASRVYGYMYAASLEAFHSAKPGSEVVDAVSAAAEVGDTIFLYQKIPSREIDSLVRRYSPEGRTKAGQKIGEAFATRAEKDGYFESVEEAQPKEGEDLWSWEPTGINRTPFADPGYGKVKPLVIETSFCTLPEPDKGVMKAEVLEMFRDYKPSQTAEPGVLVFLSGIATPTPPGLMLQIAAVHASDARLDNESALNLLALVAISDLDAGIAIWREKRRYMIARPETVYNRLTGITIELARETPNHPAYPSGHSGFTAAATSIMEKLIGKDTPLRFFVNEDLAAPNEEWIINNPKELREIVNWSRVRAAIHTRTDVNAGENLGTCIGGYVYEHYREKGWIK